MIFNLIIGILLWAFLYSILAAVICELGQAPRWWCPVCALEKVWTGEGDEDRR